MKPVPTRKRGVRGLTSVDLCSVELVMLVSGSRVGEDLMQRAGMPRGISRDACHDARFHRGTHSHRLGADHQKCCEALVTWLL